MLDIRQSDVLSLIYIEFHVAMNFDKLTAFRSRLCCNNFVSFRFVCFVRSFRFVRLSIAFGRWAHARPSTKRFVFGGSVNCVRTFFWGAAAPQTPRDDGLNLARPSAKISPKTKRLVDGRAGAHRPNAIDESAGPGIQN